jgi:hypothetical protein
MIQTDNRKRKRKGEMEVCPQKESFPGDKGGQDANKNTGKTHQLMTASAPSKGSSSLSPTLVLTSASVYTVAWGRMSLPDFPRDRAIVQ